MPDAAPLHLRFDAFEVDEREARLTRQGQPLAAAPKVFGLLCTLARRPNELLSKDELLDAIWGHRFVSDSVLKSTISDLRMLLGDDVKQPRFIETVARRGYRFIGTVATVATGAVAVPAAGLPPLIGRAEEQRHLHALWAEALGGRRRMAWIAGEAGIGKTSLIEHFMAGLGGDVTVAHGHCIEQHGAGEPYMPVLEALAALCRDDAGLPALLRQVAPTWLLQMPWLADETELAGLRAQLAGAGQERMLRELGELLDRLSRERPLLLVTEDLHWSDRATLRLMDHIARRRSPARLMWLASFRLVDILVDEHPLRALRHELKLHGLADEQVLDPFSEREVADYLAARQPRQAAGDATEALAQGLHAQTDGLPLYVANVVDEAIARDEVLTPARLGESMPVPESLAGVIGRQIERLPAEHRALLEAASVCGVEFGAATVAEALQRPLDWVNDRGDALARGQQWLKVGRVGYLPDGTVEGRYTFRHALYRQVLYQGLGGVRRARLHGSVAEALLRVHAQGGGVTAAELALQFELAGQPMSALRHYAEAAQAALRSFAPPEAMALVTHALSLLPACPGGPDRDRLELLLLGSRVAALQLQNLSAPEAQATYERVRALRAYWADATSGLDIELGWVEFSSGRYEQALAIAQAAHAENGGEVGTLREVARCNLLGTTLSYMGRLDEACRHFETGLAAREGLGERLEQARGIVDMEVSLRCRLGQTLAHLGDIDAAKAQIAMANERAMRLGPFSQRLGLVFAGMLGIQLDDEQAVLAAAQALQGLVDAHSVTQAEGLAQWLLGWARTRAGAAAEGHALIVAGDRRESEEIGLQRGRPGVLGHAAAALALAGRLPEAQAQIEAALAMAQRWGERLYLPDLLVLRSRISHACGQAAEAEASALAAWREAESQQANWLVLKALLELAERRRLKRDELRALGVARAAIRCTPAVAAVTRADALLQR